MAILTILKENIRHKRGAFKSIIFLMLLVSMTIAIMISVITNFYTDLDNAVKKSDIGDFVSYIYDENLTPDILDKLNNSKLVDHIRDEKGIAGTKKILISKKQEANTVSYKPSYDSVKCPLVNDNEKSFIDNPPALKQGEAYVPLSFKIQYNSKKNDTISFPTADGTLNVKIKGFFQDAFNGSFFMGIKNVFISDEDYKTLGDNFLKFEDKENAPYAPNHTLHIFKAKDCKKSIPAFRKALTKETEIINFSDFSMTRAESRYYTSLFHKIASSILLVFAILMFVITIIVIGHSISTSIEMDYVNLGILKAQGFTKHKIRLILISQYIIAELIGIILGVILAYPVLYLVMPFMEKITGIISKTRIAIPLTLLCISIIIIISMAFLLIRTQKVSKISPVKAINGNNNSVYFDSRINIKISKKILPLQIALRQITSNIKQYIGTSLIAGILVFFAMTMTIISSSVTSNDSITIYGGIKSDIDISAQTQISNEKYKEIYNEMNKISPVEKVIYQSSNYYLLDGDQYMGSVYNTTDGFTSMLGGRKPKHDNEILITKILSEETGKKIGDTVKITKGHNTEEYIITGYYQCTNDAGKTFGMTFKAAERIDGEQHPYYVNYIFKDKSNLKKVTKMLNAKYSDILKCVIYDINKDSSMKTIQDSLNSMTYFVYFLTVLITMVIVSMFCTKAFVKERIDIGTYKAFGLTDRALRLSFSFRFLIIGIVGSVIGIILALLFTNKLLSLMFEQIGISNFVGNFTLPTILIPTATICLCFVIFSYLSSRKVKKVSVRELITE